MLPADDLALLAAAVAAAAPIAVVVPAAAAVVPAAAPPSEWGDRGLHDQSPGPGDLIGRLTLRSACCILTATRNQCF